MKQSAFRKAVAGLLGIFILGCILAMTLVIIVDPFFHYHKPLMGFPYLIDNQLSQNPGMAGHMEYDSVILGSSMTVNFQTDWFKELMGLNTIKLSYSGAYPKDQSNIMKIIFDSGHEVKEVFLGIDVITYMGGVDETKYPIPEYLYDDKALEKYRKNHTGPFTLQRYKGLGEMDAEQLWETTLDPERRLLKLVEIEDARMASSVTEMLMGTEVPPRKAFIYENATEAELDI